MWRRIALLAVLGAALGVQPALAQEGPNPARGDFGPVPQPNAGVIPNSQVFGPPSTPTNPVRPSSWPTEPGTDNAGAAGKKSSWMPGGTSLSHIPYTDVPDNSSTPPSGTAGQTAAPSVPNPAADAMSTKGFAPCEGAQIIARVGSEVILACEVLGSVNEALEKHKAEIPPDQLPELRAKLIQQHLRQHIETKLVFLDAKHDIPTEAFPNIENRLSEYFEKSELDKMLKRAGVNSREELDARFQSLGTSLAREKRTFMERTMAQEWTRQKVKFEGEITATEMVAYYREHPEEFEQPSQARWEELMVRLSKYRDKNAAFDAIAEMGNQVLNGKPLADIAREKSDGPSAAEGGRRDWTTKGNLVSEELDHALFGLPVGQLSQIIETKQGFHIIRVVERKEASRTPFVEAQVKIRDKIRDKKTKDQLLAYIEKLEKRTPVSTIFDAKQQASLPASPKR